MHITHEEAKEVERLWHDYRAAIERTLEIMSSEGTSPRAIPKIVAEDSKAGKAINRIQEIYRGEGKSTTITGGGGFGIK
jgi:hypothetical protein